MRNNKKFTNYEKAVEAFENQLLNISKALHTWKILAFICLGIAFLALSGNIYLSTRSTLIPYVIEVDEAGNAKAINPAYQKNYEPKEEFLIYSLKEFVRNFRWISLDPVVQNSLYSKAMNLLIEPMQEKLKEISLEENLSNLIQEKKSRLNELNKLLNIGEKSKTNTWNKRKQELSIAD